MNDQKRAELMKAIRDEIWHLKESPLYAERIKNKMYPVIGDGSHHAKIMFIGEAPGRNEAETGRPFCGQAGRVLDELLASINLPRSDVYITNIVKDRPPLNRDPFPEEIAIYGPFLDRQIEIIQPRIIATLGRHAMSYIMKKFNLEDKIQSISVIHGQFFKTKSSSGDLIVVPLFHPAVAVYDASKKTVLAKDFQLLDKLKLTI